MLLYQRKFNVTVTTALIQSGLLNVLELDSYLAKQIETGGSKSAEFAARLIHQCICGEQPLVTFTDFFYSLDMLAKMEFRKRLPAELQPIVDELRKYAPGPFAPFKNADLMGEREQLVGIFEGWVRTWQKPKNEAAEDEFFEKVIPSMLFILMC